MNFAHNLEQFKDNIALEDEEGTTLSYQELALKADVLANKIGQEKQFFIVKCRNNFDTIIAYLAALRGNHTVLMLDADLDTGLLDNLIACYQPNGLWESGADKNYHYRHLERTTNTVHSDLALLLSTSGSTGSPKLVKLTLNNLQSNASSIAEYLKISSSEAPITTLPLHYSYGLSIINSHLLVGAKILLTSSSVVSKEFWQFFKTAKASSFAGVPYTYEMLKRLRIENMDLSSLRYFTQAGGKLAPHLIKYFATIAKNKGIDFFTMYGQTEATARISWLPADQVLSKVGSIGIPIPKGNITLESASGDLIDTINTEGELIYQGDNVMMGYAESAQDLAKGDQLKSVLRTGDLAKVDIDGFYFITGRLKRFIKIFGNRVNLEEIELSLSHAGFECKCVGEDNCLAIATINKDNSAIKQFIVEKYRFHHSIINPFFLNEFPLNSSGKTQYADILLHYKGISK